MVKEEKEIIIMAMKDAINAKELERFRDAIIQAPKLKNFVEKYEVVFINKEIETLSKKDLEKFIERLNEIK